MNVYRYAQGKSHKKVWDPILNDSVSQPNRLSSQSQQRQV